MDFNKHFFTIYKHYYPYHTLLSTAADIKNFITLTSGIYPES